MFVEIRIVQISNELKRMIKGRKYSYTYSDITPNSSGTGEVDIVKRVGLNSVPIFEIHNKRVLKGPGGVLHYKFIRGCAPQGFLLRPNPRNLVRY